MFRDSTVITVAHRLATIVGGDFVLVMDKGRMGEFGPPDELLRNPDGLFSSLVAVSKRRVWCGVVWCGVGETAPSSNPLH